MLAITNLCMLSLLTVSDKREPFAGILFPTVVAYLRRSRRVEVRTQVFPDPPTCPNTYSRKRKQCPQGRNFEEPALGLACRVG
jgi:hypothetical protein